MRMQHCEGPASSSVPTLSLNHRRTHRKDRP